MAKFGKFVGKNFVGLTNNEVNMVKAYIKDYLTPYAVKLYGVDNVVVDYKFTNISNIFNVNFGKTIEGRCAYDKNRFSISGVKIMIYKNEGVLEIDWQNNKYEPFEGYNYDMSVTANGYKIHYKSRTKYNIVGETYAYDSELKALLDNELKTAIDCIAKQTTI